MSEKKLLAGFGRVNITPEYSLPLRGYGNSIKRMSRGCLDGLFATCVAMTGENGETVLAISVDMAATPNYIVEPLFDSLVSATGVPADHIMVSATHTHSGPDIGCEADPNIPIWKQVYVRGITDAALAALADRREARICIGTTHTERLNFVRHYILENGTYAGDNFGDFKSSPISNYATPVDNQMQLVRFVREGAKNILMVNWQAHPKLASTAATEDGRRTREYMSADFVAPCRDYVEEKTGDLFVFYLGASGNVNPISRIKEHGRTTEYRQYGEMLGEVIVSGSGQLNEAAAGDVQARRVVFKAQVDHTEDHLAEDAKRIQALWRETNDYQLCAQAGKPCGIVSPYHADSILIRANNPGTEKELPLTAACLGPVCFVAAPYEMFDTNGKYVKDHSPCAATLVLTCANGYNDYIASEAAFDYSSYEVHYRSFVRGTAEALADTMVGMLRDMKADET